MLNRRYKVLCNVYLYTFAPRNTFLEMTCYNNDMITATLLDILIQCCMCCSVLQCVATCCRVLQCVAVCVEMCCNTTRYIGSFPQPRSSVLHCVLHCALHCVAVCCSTLQCVATCCCVLQCVAVCVEMCCSALHSCGYHPVAPPIPNPPLL